MTDIIGFVQACTGLASVIGGILGFFVAKYHLSPKIQAVADDLEATQTIVNQHKDQIATVINVAQALAPQAQKVIADNQAKIDALTAEINAKTDQLNQLKAAIATPATPTA